MAVRWPAFGPLTKCHHSMQHVGYMRNVGKTRVRIKSTVAHIRASFGLFGWFTYGNAKVLPKSGKQERNALVPSFFTVCGPEQGVGSGTDLGQFCFIWFIHG